MLPDSVFSEIVKPIPDTTFERPSDELDKLEKRIDTLRTAFQKSLVDDAYIVDADMLKYLEHNFDVRGNCVRL